MDDGTPTAVADAPASSTTSAPATTTTTSTESPSPTDRPSFKDALPLAAQVLKAHRDRKQATPAVGATPALPDGQTTPAGEITTAATPAGPIPLAVHTKALENARTKAAQEEQAKFRAQFGDPQGVAEVMQWARKAATDRVGFLRGLITEAMGDPQLAQEVRSLAGHTLRGGQTAEPTADAPAPDFQDSNGNQFYSAKVQQARDAWLIAKVKEEILGDVQPQLQTVDQLREERQQESKQRQLQQTMDGHIAQAKTWPGFTEHKDAIYQALAAAPMTSGHPAEEALLLRQVYDAIVGPKLSDMQRSAWTKDLQTRATSGTVNPASTGMPSGVPKNVRAKTGGTFKDALAWAATQTGAQ